MLVLGGACREQTAGFMRRFVLYRLAGNFAVANSAGLLSIWIHVDEP